jgi:tricarballylate dehydrogenase
MSTKTTCDVIVIGGGSAALEAAIAAKQSGAEKVVMIEKAPKQESGGNAQFSHVGFRFVHSGAEELRAFMPQVPEERFRRLQIPVYSRQNFLDDLNRVTQGRIDPVLAECLVDGSNAAVHWMKDIGVKWEPEKVTEVDGKLYLPGGHHIHPIGGGPGMLEQLRDIAFNQNRIEIRYDSRVRAIHGNDRRVEGVRVSAPDGEYDLEARAIIVCAGGFQANAEMRTRYLGPGWELAKVRGTRFNTGDGIRMALEIGAMPTGNWSGGHAVGWDRNAPEFGDLTVGDNFQKHSYPWGIYINANGERFVDEGADFRNYTYAKYGRVILMQPGQFCWQVFDKKVLHLLRDEYRIKRITKVSANTLPELVEKLDGVNAAKALDTITAYNAAVKRDVPFNPNIKDGRCTVGLAVPKSNWAIAIEEPPFEAYAVTCGLTFTFGGVKIDTSARVIDTDGAPIPGLHAAGEMVGGIFYFNYPGGTGLTNGSVFGRIAGTTAGARARGRNA